MNLNFLEGGNKFPLLFWNYFWFLPSCKISLIFKLNWLWCYEWNLNKWWSSFLSLRCHNVDHKIKYSLYLYSQKIINFWKYLSWDLFKAESLPSPSLIVTFLITIKLDFLFLLLFNERYWIQNIIFSFQKVVLSLIWNFIPGFLHKNSIHWDPSK